MPADSGEGHGHTKLNLRPLNPTPGYPAVGTPPAVVRAFRDRLVSHGVNVTVRRTRASTSPRRADSSRRPGAVAPAVGHDRTVPREGRQLIPLLGE
ncbi:MAG: putative dual-specificity methyltransferase RlmN [Acidimicrobiaceae bacterium]|jgi:hypothetical protein|nr:putative dual-specificity methyltransferase RlmN [Acidimicrobiaceae bacterium]